MSRLDLQPDGVVVTIDKLEQDSVGYAVAHSEWIVAKSTTQEFPFVIGADGHRSSVRRALGIKFPEVAPAQYYAVFEFRSNLAWHDEMRIVLGEGTTDVLWPLPNRSFRFSFQLQETPQFESRVKDRLGVCVGEADFPLLGEENLRSLIAERAPWFDASVERIDWRIAVRFERRLAEAFSRERVGLAGDAAHLAGPIGGQSMNRGLAEVYVLAEAIAGALGGGESDPCFQAYNQQFLTEWRRLLGLDGDPRGNGEAESWVLGHKEQLLASLPASGPELAVMAKQFGLPARS